MQSKVVLGIFFVASTFASCSSSDSTWWPGPGYSNEAPDYVTYGAPIESFCTGRLDSTICITIVDSSDGKPLTNGEVGASRAGKWFHYSDQLGRMILRNAISDSLYFRVIGFQKRRIPFPQGCIDSIVVPLSARTISVPL